MFDKIINKSDFTGLVKDGMVIMVGGFLGCGTPETLIDLILASGAKNLTLICNDTSFVDRGVGRLVAAKQAAKVITSHIGTNPETGKQMVEGTLNVELVPQGTLAERIRCAGAGLGGVLTPTGVGTVVEEGKKITVDSTNTCLNCHCALTSPLLTAAVSTRPAMLSTTQLPAISTR